MKLPLISALDLRPSAARSTNMYAAARTTRLTGDWSPTEANVNEIIGASSKNVRARVRQLVRDFPYFSRAVNVLCDYTVGAGILFQSRIRKGSDELDKRRCQQVEDAFNFWADEADIAGNLHYYEMMELAKRQDAESGEFILIKHDLLRDRQRYVPYALQMLEADWLTSLDTSSMGKGNEIHQGIEYDPITGRKIAYHFVDPDGWGRVSRVPADRVIHGYKTLRPGQLRGISPFAPGVLVANDLNSLMDSEIDASKMASKYLAMVTTDNPLGRQLGVGAETDAATGKKIETLENAIIEYLRPGETVTLASNPRPGTNFPPFVKLILCMFAVTTGVPYELVSGNYEGMNYSVGKMVRTDFAHQLRPIAARHVRHFGIQTIRPFFDSAVMRGRLSFPGYFTDPARWQRGEWQPPGMERVDPSREVKASIDEIKSALRSPQEVIKARGRDPEDVVREIAAFKTLCDEYGVSVQEVSTAMANNPAALDDQDAGRGVARQILDALDELQERI